ncbi:DUF551 domain-containing protein [Salmonella enterica]|uniref:DUF551 domain-containing protein n=1 Tax=Salmonella enterica TaxID=28901 RepID=A0A747SP03_SALER|nr:DUF551 domain-containing protein [Salmonella enterica]ECU9209713.1 DUF551 domain-containing protein [Salmonella enterica subsp. enterica serovar Gatuni]EDK1940359.1 hypothetical protein [Salmonella enterica subsp. enterica serovar Muenchen]EEJ6535950.1 DUF551 domain-containing protein [Salmonella enterica subsp. enterica]EAW0247410.1 DUF551 domain-containing protein [Salmonella enterica]
MSYIDKQALRISELEELNELLREKVKKLESDLWDKEQLRQVYSEKSFNLDSKVRELEARNQKDFVWRGNEISRLNDEVDELKEKLEAANRRSAELGRDCWTYENTVKTLLERAESAESACTEAARILKSGERMPDSKTAVLVAREFDRKGDWRMKWATYIPGHPDANDGWVIPGASWKPSHWMPLPEPPQEVNRG